MAKQKGLFPIEGKMGDKSFYYARREGWQVRSINPTIGERVKKSQEYLNTRKTNAEFGAASDFAAKTLQPIRNRWRYILRPDIQSALTTAAKNLMNEDNGSPLGQRQITAGRYMFYQFSYCDYNKGRFPIWFETWLDNNVFLGNAGTKLLFNNGIGVSIAEQEKLHSYGADMIRVEVYGFRVRGPYWHHNQHRYLPSVSEMTYEPIAYGEARFLYDEEVLLLAPRMYDTPFLLQNTSEWCSGIFLVFKCCKIVNGTKHVLQGMCVSEWREVPDYQ